VIGTIVDAAEVSVDTGVPFFIGVYVFVGGWVEADGIAFKDLCEGSG
jgi:hypothetical protein